MGLYVTCPDQFYIKCDVFNNFNVTYHKGFPGHSASVSQFLPVI